MAPVSAADFPLKAHPGISKPDGPVLVCILDGFGYNKEHKSNAIHLADTPVYHRLKKLGSERFRYEIDYITMASCSQLPALASFIGT